MPQTKYSPRRTRILMPHALVARDASARLTRCSRTFTIFEQPDAVARLPRAPYCIKDKVAQNGQAVPLITPTTLERNCLIKGNINAKGERIYHMPEQTFYDKTVIDESKGERWFCTEEDGIKAGWRKR